MYWSNRNRMQKNKHSHYAWWYSRYRTLFPYKPDPKPSFFRHTLSSRIQNLNLFWGPQKFLGPQKRERKHNHNSTIFWAKNKIRMKLLWYNLLEFLLFNEVFKNLIFFTYQDHLHLTSFLVFSNLSLDRCWE
mgnify:CR=1 FL=1